MKSKSERWICGKDGGNKSDTGRALHMLMSNVKDRERVRIDVNHYVTQFITGPT